MGATAPEEYGDYFAWGEVSSKGDYSWNNYRWCNPTDTMLTKYCTDNQYGVVDNLVTLEDEDNAAITHLGNGWRMPTQTEWKEIQTQCIWHWVTENGVRGYKVVSKSNGNSIFLPATGYRKANKVYDIGE